MATRPDLKQLSLRRHMQRRGPKLQVSSSIRQSIFRSVLQGPPKRPPSRGRSRTSCIPCQHGKGPAERRRQSGRVQRRRMSMAATSRQRASIVSIAVQKRPAWMAQSSQPLPGPSQSSRLSRGGPEGTLDQSYRASLHLIKEFTKFRPGPNRSRHASSGGPQMFGMFPEPGNMQHASGPHQVKGMADSPSPNVRLLEQLPTKPRIALRPPLISKRCPRRRARQGRPGKRSRRRGYKYQVVASITHIMQKFIPARFAGFLK